MPKIIKDLESRLLAEAQQQIEEAGYGAMTIRSVAKACGIGIGTMYNYFPSKETLVATYLLEDWKQCITAIEAVSTYSPDSKPVCLCIYDHLNAFSDRHKKIFRDSAAGADFAGSFSRYHTLLRAQLAHPLRPFCRDNFAAEFIAESLLTWTMAGKPFDEIYGMLEKLF